MFGCALLYSKNKICQVLYTKTLKFAMGEDVIANKSISLIDSINGVAYVDTIQVSDNNSTWVNVLDIDEIELAEVEDVNVES